MLPCMGGRDVHELQTVGTINFRCKAIFLGQSGSGKSTVLNAVYNSDVSRESLSKPAPVGTTGRGVTSEVRVYLTDHGTLLTDTIGFDDNRFDPEKLALEMRRVLRASQIGFTHIVLVLPLGRITAATRIYLAMLDKMFGTRYHANLCLYVNRCDDGTTAEEFISTNSDDEDLASLCKSLLPFSEDCPRVMAGTLLSHRNAERDQNHLEDREEALGNIKRFLDTRLASLNPPAGDALEIIKDFIDHVMRNIFMVQSSLGRAFQLLKSEKVIIRTYYPNCPVCSSDTYTLGNMAMQLACGHIFHTECCKQSGESAVDEGCFFPTHNVRCPKCGKMVSYPGEELPDITCTDVGGKFQLQAVLVAEEGPCRQPQECNMPTKFIVPPKRETFGSKTAVLYHLTDAGEEIKSSGEMLRGARGLVGGGIYFADSPETCRAKAESRGYIIKANVLVGTSKQVQLGPLKLGVVMNQYTFTRLQAEGYDSLHVTGLNTGDEFIVYNKDQVELISIDYDDDMPA